jgi:DsbC/DsbD-like thiol-disulfide interchange protein
MTRTQLLSGLLAVLVITLAWHSEAKAGGNKSDSKVKATATVTKPDANGKQTVTITLDIEKEWHVYANPVQYKDLEQCQTKVAVSAQENLTANIKYPSGKLHVDGDAKFYIYQDRAVIQVELQRTLNDASSLSVNIDVNACKETTDKKTGEKTGEKTGFCLPPGTIKLVESGGSFKLIGP